MESSNRNHLLAFSAEDKSPRKDFSRLMLVAAIVLFGTFQMVVSLHKYYTLQASTMDLGYFEQELWKISHGNWWAFSTVFQTPALAADGCLWLYPLAYGFRFLGGAPFLFAVQALGTAVTAWGLYRASLLHRLSSWQATAIAITFLLYPAIIGGSQFDFHPDFIALPFIVWAYVYYTAGRKGLYYLFFLFAVLAKNVALIPIAGWGFGLIIFKRQFRDGIIAIVASAAIFVAEMDWIVPLYFHGGTEHLNLSLYAYLGVGFTGILRGVFMHFPLVLHHFAGERSYALWIFGPVLFLPLLGSTSVPAMLSLLLLNALSSFAPQQMINDQYQVILSGWVFLSLIESLTRFRRGQRLFISGIGSFTVLFASVFMINTIVPTLNVTSPALGQVKSAVAHIPSSDVVWTQNHLGVWAYRFPVMGIAREAVPGHLVDGLPRLWAESKRSENIPTALLGQRPVTPYFADVIAAALHADYHISFHQGSVFVLSGFRRFKVPSPSSIGDGWQPSNRLWTIPAWTQETQLGTIEWSQHSVFVPAEAKGVVFPGIYCELGPGIYEVSVHIEDRGPKARHLIVGELRIGHQIAVIPINHPTVHLRLFLAHPQIVVVSLTSTGAHAFQIQTFSIRSGLNSTPLRE